MPDKVYVVIDVSFEDYQYPLAVFADRDDATKYIIEKELTSCKVCEVPYNP